MIRSRIRTNRSGASFKIRSRGQPKPAPATPNPADTMPYPKVNEIAFLTTKEAAQRFKARVERDGLAYMSGFKRLRPGEWKDYETLNARLAWIAANDAHESQPEATPEVAKPKTAGQIEAEALIGEMVSIRDDISPKNIGRVHSDQGRWQRVLNLKNRIDAEIAAARRYAWVSQVKEALQRIKDMVAEAESSSIR